MQLRDYQSLAVNHAMAFLLGAKPGERRLYASPTGTGKSYMQLALQVAVQPTPWIVTPRLEIVEGLLWKLGLQAGMSEAATVEMAWSRCITTPIRLRNALIRGEGPEVRYLILDEAHHDAADSWQDLHTLLGYPPAVGFTASPFRGSPRSSAAFRELWGDPVWIITFAEAAARGVLAMPECTTVPLLDDDVVEASGGELVARQVSEATSARLDEAARLALAYLCDDGPWDMPTMFALPSRETAHQFGARLGGLVNVVTGETNYRDRARAFEDCVNRHRALVQIGVVSEGVDLPIRRLVDLSPCLSPVRWLQQFGRITRPSDVRPQYICCNRNLMRHGYLLDGCLPLAVYRQAEEAFGGPSKRRGGHAIGLEALGRLKAIELKLAGGVTTVAYAVSGMEGHRRNDYFVIVHPTRGPIWATKESFKNPETGAIAYGSWRRCDPPIDLSGFASVPARALTDKQKAWWKRSAPGFGLADAEPNTRQFQVLPVLCDIRERLC